MRRLLPRFAFLVLPLAMLVAILWATQVSADDVIRLKQHVKVDDVGDAECTLEVKMPTAEMYTMAKTETPNMAVLLRSLGLGRDWREFEDVDGKFVDASNSVVISYKMRGLGSTDDGMVWEIPLLQGAGLELVTIAGKKAIYQMAGSSPLGVMTAIMTVEGPADCEDLKSLSDPPRVSFRSTASRSEGSDDELDFSLDAKSQVMTCLAKSYSNPNFNYMWVAKSKFKNTGDVTLRDFRVRYQMPGYTSWSAWARAKRFVPGQTIVAPYFPIFDMEKVNSLTGSRPASLQVEYEYKTHDGELVQDSDARRLELLSPNHVLFSNLKKSEMVGWHDRFNIVEPVIASFVSSNDPVMQQLTGGVSRMAGGLAAGADDDDAIKFLEALYIFMSENNIAYQSPPGILKDGVFGQHIKYGRDVLRNRSATCIDYAVLVASACEAAGIESAVVVIPGHAFPMIYLPESGEPIPLEATMVGKGDFRAAVKKGFENFESAQNGLSQIINIQDCREAGVQCLDLPKTTVTFIKDLDYEFPELSYDESEGEGEGEKIDHPAVGHWLFTGTINGVRLHLESNLRSDGSYAELVRISSSTQPQTESAESGTWAVRGDSLIVQGTSGRIMSRKYYTKDGKLYVFFSEVGSYLGFNRKQ